MKKKNIIYIGVVGQIASGKGVLVDYLIKKLGFVSFSLSSIVHDELKRKGINNFSRKALQDLGDELRRKYRDDVLAKRVIEKIRSRFNRDEIRNYVIEGIRNPGEVKYLKTLPNFVLIGVKARRELRFKRLLARVKPWDPKTYLDFLKIDRRDLGFDQQKSGQQVGKCLTYCDFILMNNKDVVDFQRKVEELMKRILLRFFEKL